jgi:hypothetical protein
MTRRARRDARRAGGALSLLFVFSFATACGSANRPEGPAERFLRAVSRGTDVSQVEELGTVQVAQEVLDGPMCPMKDRETPDVDECPKNQENITEFQVAVTDTDGAAAVVPIEVLRKDEDEPVRMGLQAELVGSDWQFTGTTELPEGVRFPSEGGEAFGTDAGTIALYTFALMLVALVVSVGVITLSSGGRPTEEEADLTRDG